MARVILFAVSRFLAGFRNATYTAVKYITRPVDNDGER